MKAYTSKKFTAMPKNEQDIVKAGVELFRHYRSVTSKDETIRTKYAQHAGGKTLEEKGKIYSDSLMKVAKSYANIAEGHEFNEMNLRNHPSVKWAMYAIMSETLDLLIPETILDEYGRFADVKYVNWGDQLLFRVDNPDLFVVSRASYGKRKGDRQRLRGRDVVMTPINHIITIGEDWYRIATGQVNFGEWITRVALSIQNQMATEIYQAVIDTYPTLGAAYRETGAFNPDRFNRLVQRVTASNGGGRASVFGTKLALSKVLPTDQYLRFNLGDEYNRRGYLGNFQGVDLYELDQRLIPGTDDFALDEDTLLITTSTADKIVKVGIEGNTRIFDTPSPDNADLSQDHTVQTSWDVKAITSGRYAVWTDLA